MKKSENKKRNLTIFGEYIYRGYFFISIVHDLNIKQFFIGGGHKMKKNIRKIVMNYMLFDDNFWKEVFKDKKCVEYVLSVILDRKIHLIRCHRAYPIRHG